MTPTFTPPETHPNRHTPRLSRQPFIRTFLLLVLLAAFARLLWQLDAKSFWIDEAFSWERVRAPWPDLLRGQIMVGDGLIAIPTLDQHPFAYFVGLGAWLRLAGDSMFALRFPSVMAATLLVPVCWVFARLLERRQALPRHSALWAALLTALHPFFLWYGQEARMYIVWTLLAPLTVYSLLRWALSQNRRQQWLWLVAYGLLTLTFLFTHFYAALLLPVHGLIFFWRLVRGRWIQALAVLGTVGLVAAGAIFLGFRQVFSTPISGSNFVSISLGVLVPDLVNAFSLGISADLAQVWWLDAIAGGLVLAASIWAIGRRPGWSSYGWVLPAFILFPVGLILVANLIRPAYMNARHISLISSAYVLLMAGGIALIGQWRRWLGMGAAALIIAGMIYSSAQYYTNPAYGKGSLAQMGEYIRREFHPGDLLLLNPPEAIPLYRYHLPLDLASGPGGKGWQGVPLLHRSVADTEALLETLRQQSQRIWLVAGDPENTLDEWLRDHTLLIKDVGYASPISWQHLSLYVTTPPVLAAPPATIEHPLDVVFGDKIRLLGYTASVPVAVGSVTPITLYWQPLTAIDKNYKYVLRLLAAPDGKSLSTTEREPYDGFLPTSRWQPETVIEEYSDLFVAHANGAGYQLELFWYDPATLETLPITQVDGAPREGEHRLLLPFSPP